MKENKMITAIKSESLSALLEETKIRKIQRKDIVNLFQNMEGDYVLIYYKDIQ